MIAKCIKGKGFRGAAEYDLQPHKSILLESNMAGETPRELATEFGAIQAIRPNLSKATTCMEQTLRACELVSNKSTRNIRCSTATCNICRKGYGLVGICGINYVTNGNSYYINFFLPTNFIL